jgi:hypothetical protein
VEGFVTRIIDNFDRDLTIFSRLDSEFAAILDREREEAQSSEARVRKELEGRELHITAREKVRDAIAERLRGQDQVPSVIASLLHEGWHEVLLRAYLRGGAEGDEWKSALYHIDRLLWSIRPKHDYEDRRELLRSIPELLRSLRESLGGVAFDQRRLASWFKELQALHIAALRGSGPGRTEPESASGVHTADATSPTAMGGRSFSGASTKVPTGAWIQIRRDDGETLRVKLAWRSPQTGVHLFVDRSGHKALELSVQELDSLLERGAAVPLGDDKTPLVDRALESVAESLGGT